MNLLRMFGKILYGQALYGSNQKSSSGNVQVGQIWFWDYDFSDILISEIPNSYEGNEFDLQTYQLTTHGQGLSNWLIKGKRFTVKGRIQAQDQEILEKKINFIKAKLLSGEKNLYFRRKGWLLKTKAAVSELSIPRKSRTINTAEIQITFFIPIPFWVATNGVEKVYSWINGLFNATIEYERGSSPSTPTVTLIFNQARDVNKITLTLWGKELIINHLIKTGDSVEINSELLDVAVNWEWGKDRNWEFWQLMRWENMLTIAINGQYETEVFIQYADTYV